MRHFLLLFAAFAAFLLPVSADTNAPEVSSAFVSALSVDVTNGPETVSVTIVLSDDDSGFQFGNYYLRNENGITVVGGYFDNAQRTDTGVDGDTYVVTMDVPQFAVPGLWRVDLLVVDIAENARWLGPDDEPLPVPGDMNINVVNEGVIDTLPPELTAVYSPYDTVNLDEEGATFTITLDIIDDVSGFYDGFIEWYDPSGDPDFNLWTYFSIFDITTGDANAGSYTINVDLPAGLAHGTWSYRLYMQDTVGNPANVQLGELLVTDEVIPPPTAPRTNFIAQAVDAVQYDFTTAGGGWIYQTMETNDGVDAAMSLPIGDNEECSFQTTVTGPGTLSFDWRVDSEQFQDFLSVSVGEDIEAEISGNTLWDTVDLVIPAGVHVVTWRYAKSASGSNGADRGWVDRVRFEADSDVQLPTLQAFRISQRSIDLTSGPQHVTFTMEITDDSNGFSEGKLRLYDAMGNEVVERVFNFADSTSSNPLDDVFEVELEIPDDAAFGLWRAEVELMESLTANMRTYGLGGDPFPMRAVEFFHAGDNSANDDTGPLAQAISMTPGSVDVSTGGVEAVVTVHVTDFIQGFEFGTVSLLIPNGATAAKYNFSQGNRIEGDEFNGIYQVNVVVPRFAQPGTWELGVELQDFGLNYSMYPNEVDYPVNEDPSFTVANSGQIDGQPPTVASIDITPSTVDTGSGSANIQVTLTLEDDFSGVQEAFLYFYNPADEFQTFLAIRVDTLTPISTDGPLSKTYQLTRNLPQGSPEGQWRVRMFVADNVGNLQFYGAGETEFPEPGDGYFTVGSTNLSWFKQAMAFHSLTGDDALPAADPDKDGSINALEVLLGSDPADETSTGFDKKAVIRDATHLHFEFTVDPSLSVTEDGDFLEITSGGAPAMRLTGQSQGGLSGVWNNSRPVLQSGSTYRVSVALSSGEKGFIRLMFVDP